MWKRLQKKSQDEFVEKILCGRVIKKEKELQSVEGTYCRKHKSGKGFRNGKSSSGRQISFEELYVDGVKGQNKKCTEAIGNFE